MTLTLEIPDDLAKRLESIPPEQRNRFAIAVLSEAVDNLPLPEDNALDAETVSDLHQAFQIGMDDSITVSLEDYAKRRGITLLVRISLPSPMESACIL